MSQPKPSRRPSALTIVFSWLAWTLTLILFSGAYWVRQKFGTVTFEQIVSNLPTPGKGGAGNDALLADAQHNVLILPLVISTLGTAAYLWWRSPGSNRALKPWLGLGIPVVASITALATLLTVLGVPRYLAVSLDSRSIADYYVTPTITHAPAKPRNLITVYMESIETAYRDQERFGQNMLADLDQATAGWASYDELRQDPTGGWTMAGIVATQCGIPLKARLLAAGVDKNAAGEQVDHYLPGATCLGDLLAQQGYSNSYVGGAYTRFAGKDTYLTDHGYSSVQGLSAWQAAGEDPSNISVWGLSDKRMFAHALETLTELRDAGKPFNLTILTLDSHEPGGVFDTCTTDDSLRMVTAIRCSMKAVAGFLGELRKQGYLDDTVVMVMGDHLKNTGDSDSLRAELESTPLRTIVMRVWSPDEFSLNRTNGDQFSILPTTLELLGFKIPAGQAGLGVSLIGDHSLAGTAMELPSAQYRSLLETHSTALYRQFWQG